MQALQVAYLWQWLLYLADLSKEKTFVPYTDDMELPEESQYHFISECFFLTHQALHIGYSIVHKIIKLHNSIVRLQKIFTNMLEANADKLSIIVQIQLRKGN